MNTIGPTCELFEGKSPYQKWRNRGIKDEKEDALMIKLQMMKLYFDMCFDLLFFNSWIYLLISLLSIRNYFENS